MSTRDLTRAIAKVAAKTAARSQQITEGTVIARLPDGTLLVDDGKGGCLRQAPAANVRVGQKIKLGVEPSLGSQTNLAQVTLTITGSTVPCPNDWRPECEDLIGAPCPPGETIDLAAELQANAFGAIFFEPKASLTYPGRTAIWENRLSEGTAAGVLAGGPDDDDPISNSVSAGTLGRQVGQTISRRASNYPSTVFTPYADHNEIQIERTYLDFDTSALPAGVTIAAATLRMYVIDAETAHNANLCVVPSTVPDAYINPPPFQPVQHRLIWGSVVDDVILGSASIFSLIDAEPDPPPYPGVGYPVDISLDPELLTALVDAVETGRVKLCLMTKSDQAPDSFMPAAPGLFSTGLETTASGTPDYDIHIAPGSWVIDGVTYTDGAGYTVSVNQQDGNGATLAGDEAYILGIVRRPGDAVPPLVIKGAKADPDPRRPAILNEGPGGIVGGIVWTWVYVPCSGSATPFIADTDISEAPIARPFENLGTPAEIRSVIDIVSFAQTFEETKITLTLSYFIGTGTGNL